MFSWLSSFLNENPDLSESLALHRCSTKPNKKILFCAFLGLFIHTHQHIGYLLGKQDRSPKQAACVIKPIYHSHFFLTDKVPQLKEDCLCASSNKFAPVRGNPCLNATRKAENNRNDALFERGASHCKHCLH